MPRLDKVLAQYQLGSRKEVKELIKSKHVLVNEKVITQDNFSIKANDEIQVGSFHFVYQEFVYLMMNKQKNRICSHDTNGLSIYDDLDLPYPKDLSSIGRLDKDTTGLLILTNDGQLNHKITSKHNQSIKRYLITLEKPYQDQPLINIDLKEDGVVSAKSIEVIDLHHIILGITDGKYYQVKRMIHSIGNEVLELHRVSIGSLVLDANLNPGETRALSKEEVLKLHG